MRAVPKGWSIKWKASRRRTFRVNHTTKTISVPMPAQYAGLPALGSAIHLAVQISKAMNNAEQTGMVPALMVKAWPFLFGKYFSLHYRNVIPCGGYVANRHALKTAGIQAVREVLRFYQSPDAWRIPRRKAGSPIQWQRHNVNTNTLSAIAHRKVMMDYLKVNDPAYPLPAIAKARLKKINQPQQP
jgi:hypothetical protein